MKISALFLMVVVVIAGCNSPIDNSFAVDNAAEFANEILPLKAAKLKPLNLDSVETFEAYKSFVDHTNSLIGILNKQSDTFNIEPFSPTLEGWRKASTFITEYGPLINNYNEVVNAAKAFESSPNEENKKDFYLASGKFAFETGLIVGAVFYAGSYQAVGIAYRSLGFNKLALKCGSCVSAILSQAHWTIRTALVEGASETAQFVIETVETLQENGTIESAKNSTQVKIKEGLHTLNEGLIKRVGFY